MDVNTRLDGVEANFKLKRKPGSGEIIKENRYTVWIRMNDKEQKIIKRHKRKHSVEVLSE